ncbi:MAG TPA: tetratricopeptide repeat protein [Gemmatimonadaceae bacterium]|nr:tetratricopeptide repeat protein [Gemmatimonadaceae bacterium]
MTNSALIEDLEKQFAENPRRVFARLANEYRKSGDLDRAIEMCRKQVPLQPTYISGYIVLGQALFESGQLDEARTTFETALGLDPENLIALRQLGDIARETGDDEGARAWYHRLLEVDPQNEEIAEQLRAMEPAAGARAHEAVSWNDIHPEHAAPEPAAPEMISAEPPVLELSPAFPDIAAFAPAAPAMPPAPEPEAPAAPEPLDLDLDALGVSETTGAAPEPPVPAAEPMVADVMAFDELEFPSADELAGSEPVAMEEPALAADAFADVDLAFTEPAPAGAAAPVVPPAREPEPAIREERAPAVFVTETMAELYLQQGFTDRALEIYRQLAAQRPADAALRERIAHLERGDLPARDGASAPRSMRAFFAPFASRRPPEGTVAADANGHATEAEPELAAYDAAADAAPAAPDVAVPSPVSVASVPAAGALSELFGARDVRADDEAAASTLAAAFNGGGAPQGAIAGQPARAASDALSLSDVFGDARPRGEGGAPRAAAHVSFDEFFARGEGGAAAEAPAADADAAAESDDTGEKDLELFHAWLEGLKK